MDCSQRGVSVCPFLLCFDDPVLLFQSVSSDFSMETQFVNYYTELVRFREEREERRELSHYQALLQSLQGCQVDSVRCGQDCQARTRLDNMVLADWLLSIDQRCDLCSLSSQRNTIIFPGCFFT